MNMPSCGLVSFSKLAGRVSICLASAVVWWTCSVAAAADSQADIAYNKGLDLVLAGKYAEAIPYLTKAVQLYGPRGGVNTADAYSERAYARQMLQEYDDAIADYNASLQLNPGDGLSYFHRGQIWELKKEFDKAIADYERATRTKPLVAVYKEDIERDGGLGLPNAPLMAVNALAWLYATHPDATYRDEKKAFEYASKAYQISGGTDAGYLDTLAAAYAENGDFEAAKSWQAKAIKLVPPDQTELREEFNARLKLYEQKEPFRQKP